MENVSFKAGTCTAKSMARLRNILNEHDEVHEYVAEKFARLKDWFNSKALSSRKDDDESYEWEEPGMSLWACETHDADNIIANTWINPLMFEEWIDTEAWLDVLYLHALSNWFKDTPEVSQEEMDKRDEVEPDKPNNPHYRLMEVKKCSTDYGAALMNGEDNWRQLQYTRKFYWNWTEGYETYEANMDSWMYDEDTEEDFKNQEKQEHERKQKVAVQLLYKKLKESKAWMKLAATQKKRSLYEDFKKEYMYCSKNLDALKECDEKMKQNNIKRRKDVLRTKLIKLNNLGSKLTTEKVKRMINEKSLRYAEVVVDAELAKYKS